MKKAAAFLLLLGLLLVLVGCGAKNPEQTPTAMEAETVGEEDGTMLKELTLMVNDRVVPVIWEENPSVVELTEAAAQKEIHVEMSMYGGWEQVGSLGRSVSRNDVQQTADNGDIMLYSGNQVVLFYGENTWAYTKLGHIDLPAEEVTALLSSGDVSITLAVS